MKDFWQENKLLIYILTGTLILCIIGWIGMGQQPFVRTALSGLTLGSLFFMVAAGLTLIFGLMDVLNFAHGSMFMIGAYIGWQFYTNPTFIFGMAPFFLALAAGIAFVTVLKPSLISLDLSEKIQKNIPRAAFALAAILGLFAFWKFDILDLADTAMVAITTTSSGNPLAEISEQVPFAAFIYRPVLMFIAGLAIAVGASRPGDKTQIAPRHGFRDWLLPLSLVLLTILSLVIRTSAPVIVLLMNGNIRFLLAIFVAFLFGLIFGTVIEITLVRPLYVRANFIVLMTMGLGYVIRELVQLLWDPLAYQMVRPPLFNGEGKAENIIAWFSGHNATIDILGVTFPSYRLFVIFLGIVMFIAILLIMNRSRLGMIIRAGVQDPEMVEALGINVRRVFTLVFALGVGMAALGGIGAAPFIPIQPNMGDQFQMQGFITVVIGGMGSYVGAFIGALLLGMARAFGDYFALKLSLSPAIAEASTVIIMIIVLLLRPQGLFGKKE